MKYKIPIAIAVIATAMIGQAQGGMINGDIHFDGTKDVKLAGGITFATATGLDFDTTSGANAIVTSSSGDFFPAIPPTATFDDLNFGVAKSSLWVSGRFTFSADAAQTISRSATHLDVDGTGILHDTLGLFADTPGEFGLSVVRNSSSTVTHFSWSSISTATPVPEPTTMIAGALLLVPFGMGVFRSLRNRKQTV